MGNDRILESAVGDEGADIGKWGFVEISRVCHSVRVKVVNHRVQELGLDCR